MEGRVYKATWNKVGRDFRIQLTDHPNIIATKASYETAEEYILDKITELLGDGEAVLEYSPRLPPTELEKKFVVPDIIRLVGNSRAESSLDKLSHSPVEYLREIGTYFHGGVCNKCRSPLGRRNHKPLSLGSVDGDGGFATIGTYFCSIFSEDFIESTGLHNDKNVKFIRAERKRGTKIYYELIGEIESDYVGVKGLIARGWRCSDCANFTASYEIPDQLWINHFILNKGVDRSLGFFVTGNNLATDLCTTREFWDKRDKKVRAKNIVSEQIGILKMESQVDKSPKLKDYQVD